MFFWLQEDKIDEKRNYVIFKSTELDTHQDSVLIFIPKSLYGIL